jgi:hypothetical protein
MAIRHNRFELVLNGQTYAVILIPSKDNPFISTIRTEPSLEGELAVGTVRRETRNKQSGKFIARHKVTGRENGGSTRKQAVISLIYDHYKAK